MLKITLTRHANYPLHCQATLVCILPESWHESIKDTANAFMFQHSLTPVVVIFAKLNLFTMIYNQQEVLLIALCLFVSKLRLLLPQLQQTL